MKQLQGRWSEAEKMELNDFTGSMVATVKDAHLEDEGNYTCQCSYQRRPKPDLYSTASLMVSLDIFTNKLQGAKIQ